MFAKTTLASAVAAALGVSAVGVAQADSIFFPYAALSETVTTVVSVINTSGVNWNDDGSASSVDFSNLHYRLYYKTTDVKTDACEEYNVYLPTSPNDVQTIDIAGIFGADTAGVLFNDPSIKNQWQQSGLDYALGRDVLPARAYLYVDNGNVGGGTLDGEAFVFEFGSGAAWGYQAFNSLSSDFRAAASQSPAAVSIMPLAEINTAFFVTPVSQDQAPDFSNDYRARLEMVTTTRGDMFNRDEILISGTVPQDIVCVGRVDVTELLSDAAAQGALADGGWGRLLNYRVKGTVPQNFNANATVDSLTPAASKFQADDGAVVIKLEYNAGSTFNGEPTSGTFNNGFIIR